MSITDEKLVSPKVSLPGILIHIVEPNSPADMAGILPNDRILEINGTKLRDDLDFRFREIESELHIKVSRDGRIIEATIKKEVEEFTGIQLSPLIIRQCRNKCVFCFVDQQPQSMRKTLHVKDDDYRYSFLHGNFITLTNVSDQEINRVIEEKLSPQYISVQVTDPMVHQKLLGLPKPDPILPKIRKLIQGGVVLHTQIVVVPEWNDEQLLEESVLELLDVLTPNCSISIVPVGLTKHRKDLPMLRTPNRIEAMKVIETHKKWRIETERKFGKPLVYCADEWFCIAEADIPDDNYYGNYEQFENGVGMLRKLECDTLLEKSTWSKRLPSSKRWIWITGKSAHSWLQEKVAPILSSTIPQLTIDVIPVQNTFWGSMVTVANLLTGQDVWQTLEKTNINADLIVLPPDVVNGDGLFLDDWSLTDLQSAVVSPEIVVFPNKFSPLIRKMLR